MAISEERWGLDPSGRWYWTPDVGGYRVYQVNEVLVARRTLYQQVEIMDLKGWGRCLFLDGEIQSAERDEFIYHELLVHPGMLAHPEPRRVLICGTGEGKVVREVLRYPGVERVVAVDIDREVVQLCQEYLERMPLDDPRVELIFGDVARFLQQYHGEPFDVVVVDVTDDTVGPASTVHSLDFYQRLHQVLASPGVVAVQGTSAFSGLRSAGFDRLYRLLRQVFTYVFPYAEYIPSFEDLWGFLVGLKDIPNLGPRGKLPSGLRYYDEETHQRVFHLSRLLRGQLGIE
ncbi:methyltransferase domain-containing protein [Desulfothermobacter acidiphilus]|uniref:spermine/spermidine synthase domain-containing protein n=1 Tax=Desulfothermobacter acidiphilus TaxID=1938353 RepID=UPI003F8B7A05